MSNKYASNNPFFKLMELIQSRFIEKTQGKCLTSNDYTNEEKAKNVQPDWEAKYGYSMILNKPNMKEYATKEEVGDIEIALDSILTIQNELIGGSTE